MDTTSASPRPWPNDEAIRHNGVTFDRRRCQRIQRIIRDCPNITRVALAQRVCEMLGWRRFNGKLPERSCRNLLDRLHTHGWIDLPPSRRPSKTAQLPPPAPEADVALPVWPEGGPRADPSCPLLVRPILAPEKAAFRLWVQRHHYLGYRPLVGESLCYAAFWKGQLVALLAWAAASLKNVPRDAYIGWDEQTKLARLPFIVQNVRFVILPEIDAPPHLASRVLAANLRRLTRDWQACYRHPVLLAETFVDESRFHGTCYRAANWIRLGLTRGFGRHSSTYRHHGVPKAAWIYPLRADALSRLRDTCGRPTIFAKEDGVATPALNPEALPLAGDGGLLDLLLSIPEVRKRRGLRHPLSVVLAISVLAMLLGKRSFLAIAEFAARLSPELLKTLGARRKSPPSEPTFRRVLARVPADEVDAAVSRWMIQQGIRLDEAIALDGKVCRGSADGDDPAVHLLSALLQREGVVIRQVRVCDKTNEIPCVKPLLQDLLIEGAMVTADALHTQQDTARFLVEQKKADYLFIAKDNQPTLRKDIELLDLPATSPPQAQTVDPGHARIDTRRIWTSTALNDYIAFPHCQQVFQIERIREHIRAGVTIKVEREMVCGLTSRSPDKASPAQLLEFARGQWTIENRLHYVRDVSFDEDRSQIRKGHGAQMMACLRNLAVSLLRLAGATNIAAALRTLIDRPQLALRFVGL